MHILLRHDQKTYTLEVEPKDTVRALKLKLTDKSGIPSYLITLYFCGRELVESKTLEQENIVKESTIKIILIQSYGDILDLSVVSEINPTLKTYIRIEEGRKVTTLKEEIYKKFNCRPEKQHLTAVNERRPEKRRYLSDSSTIYEYQLDHEYKILVYYEFEGTLTFKHRISSDIFKLKIKSNSTIRQIKDKIREELQIGTVTEIYNQSNVKLNNDTSLADNHVTPSDVLEIELLGDPPDHYRKQQQQQQQQPQPNYAYHDIPPTKQQQQPQAPYAYHDIPPTKQQQQPQAPYAYHDIPPTKQQQQQQAPYAYHDIPPMKQQQQPQPQPNYAYHDIPQQQEQPHPTPRTKQQPPQQRLHGPTQHQRVEERFSTPYQQQNYGYTAEPQPYTSNPSDKFSDSSRHAPFQQPDPVLTHRDAHKPPLTRAPSWSTLRDPGLYEKRGPFPPTKQEEWFGGGTYNPVTDEPVYQRVERGKVPDPRARFSMYQNPPVVDTDEMTDGFLSQVVIAAQNEWQEIGTILLNDFQKVLDIKEQRQHPFTSGMCILSEWKNIWQAHGSNSKVMPYNRNSLIHALITARRQDLVHQFFGQK